MLVLSNYDELDIVGYVDSDCLGDIKSTSGYVFKWLVQ